MEARVSMANPNADRNLLFGILALQMDFISRNQLIASMNAWVLDKGQPLGAILQRQGALGEEDHGLLEALVCKHLLRHGGDPARSLAALPPAPEVRQDLDPVADADVHASLLHVPATRDAHATVLPSDSAATPAQRDSLAVPETTTGLPTSAGGRFQILRPHAEGGLGAVYVARDTELNREVALKEIKECHADHAESRARFVLEAEITGGLEHPGIVPVYGLGTYPDGRPYYAMRLIRGDSLHEAIHLFHKKDRPGRDPGERSLALRGLLRRFIDVCNAVGYAHSRGVLHRDLKPANVMLGPFGETLVVDWGLAKPIGRTEAEKSTDEATLRPGSASVPTPTQMGQAMGTPAYMSPEQAAGRLDRLGPPSDVYSLGAVLYVLLTGQAPFPDKEVGPILQQVQRGQFLPPRAVQRQVPPALNAVCLKAMALLPEGRYATARALADDVEHWLADELVQAYHEPLRQRAGRWARRHRTLVSSAVVLLLTAVVGLGGGLWAVAAEQRKTAQERDRAQENLELARTAVDECFLIAKEHPLLQEDRMRQVRKLLLEKALPFYQKFQVQRPDDARLQEEMASNAFRVGYINAELGQVVDAIASYQEALRIGAALTQAQPEVVKYQNDLACTHNNLGNLQRAAGQRLEALRSFQEGLRIQTALVKAHPEVVQYQNDLARTHHGLGVLQHEAGQRPEALRSFQEGLRIRTALVKAHPEVVQYQNDLANTHHILGILQTEAGQGPEALRSYQEALGILTALVKDHPEVVDYQNDLAITHHNLGNLQRASGQGPEALRSYQEALGILTALVKDHPEVVDFQKDLASTHLNLGLLQREAGQRPEAFRSYQEALRILTVLVKDHPEVVQYQNHLASTHHNLGLLQREASQRPEALRSYQEALRIRTALVKAHPEVVDYQINLASTHHNLGLLQREASQRPEALRSYQEALRIFTALVKDHPEVIDYHVNLAGTHVNRGNLQSDQQQSSEALASYGQAIRILGTILQKLPDHTTARLFLRNAHVGRARTLSALDRHGEGVGDWSRALELDAGPGRAGFRLKRADALAHAGEHGKAASEAEELTQDKNVQGDSLYDLACVLALAGAAAARDARMPGSERRSLAEKHAARAIALLEQARGKGFFKDTKRVDHLKKDSDLDCLRQRADYQEFLASLEAKKPKQ
jgi:serine/threonine-protein kinase